MYFYKCPFFPCDYRFAVEEEIIDQPDILGDPDIMGQQEGMLEHQGVQGQQGLPSQQQGMMGQQGVPSQQQGMTGQQGMQGQQQVTPPQQQDMIFSQVDPYTYPGNFSSALNLIQDAVTGEMEDELFYNYLISIAPTEEARNIITTIRNDERRHNQMFRGIYFRLTSRRLRPSQPSGFERPTSYCDGIKRALLSELDTIQIYRRIVFAIQDRVQLNMLAEIISDELRHGSLYNLLYSDAKCFNTGTRQ